MTSSTVRLFTGAVCLVSLGAAAGDPPTATAAGPREIEVIAKRFVFEPAEIQVAVNEPVRLLVRSADGVHGIEIKQVKVRKEVPRGGTVVAIDFTPKAIGRFPILCSEYCGDEHDNMRGTLTVLASAPDAP